MKRDLATEPFDAALVGVALSLARRFGARAEDAEDIAQEALLKLVTYRDSVEDPIAWLYVVVRRLQRRWANTSEAAPEDSLNAVNPWPLIDFEIDTRRFMGRLSSRGRASLRLSLAGYSGSEAAARLGCSLRASEKALHKARRQLRKLVTDP